MAYLVTFLTLRPFTPGGFFITGRPARMRAFVLIWKVLVEISKVEGAETCDQARIHTGFNVPFYSEIDQNFYNKHIFK